MNGVVTICFDGTKDEVQEMTDRIEAINALDLPVSISEDTYEDD